MSIFSKLFIVYETLVVAFPISSILKFLLFFTPDDKFTTSFCYNETNSSVFEDFFSAKILAEIDFIKTPKSGFYCEYIWAMIVNNHRTLNWSWMAMKNHACVNMQDHKKRSWCMNKTMHVTSLMCSSCNDHLDWVHSNLWLVVSRWQTCQSTLHPVANLNPATLKFWDSCVSVSKQTNSCNFPMGLLLVCTPILHVSIMFLKASCTEETFAEHEIKTSIIRWNVLHSDLK